MKKKRGADLNTDEDQRSVTVGTKSFDAMWADLVGEIPDHYGPPRGEGWKSFDELSVQLGIAKQNVGHHVRRWIVDGKAEIGWGRSQSGRRARYVRPIAG